MNGKEDVSYSDHYSSSSETGLSDSCSNPGSEDEQSNLKFLYKDNNFLFFSNKVMFKIILFNWSHILKFLLKNWISINQQGLLL